MLIYALRTHLAEFGIVMRQGGAGVDVLIALMDDDELDLLPAKARDALLPLAAQLADGHKRVALIDRRIHAWHRLNEQCRRLATIPGIGPITVSALVATISDPSLFASGRQLAAWLRLVQRQITS